MARAMDSFERMMAREENKRKKKEEERWFKAYLARAAKVGLTEAQAKFLLEEFAPQDHGHPPPLELMRF